MATRFVPVPHGTGISQATADKIRNLQKLVAWDKKMDTVSIFRFGSAGVGEIFGCLGVEGKKGMT
ncbi:putative DNA binding protein [Corchorus olitorius]|uniref:DNA binding protein n=1 Tax=Corchorus olitorius TaxID=93759 RepID=A0A1R3KJQ7_9ROSI|nr:putative DNA binding protein [Corchorus olitorius]